MYYGNIIPRKSISWNKSNYKKSESVNVRNGIIIPSHIPVKGCFQHCRFISEDVSNKIKGLQKESSKEEVKKMDIIQKVYYNILAIVITKARSIKLTLTCFIVLSFLGQLQRNIGLVKVLLLYILLSSYRISAFLSHVSTAYCICYFIATFIFIFERLNFI